MTDVSKQDLIAAGIEPAEIHGSHLSIRFPLLGELEQFERGGLALAYICPRCSDTHLMVLTNDACVQVSFTPKEAEALGKLLLNPGVLKHDPSDKEAKKAT